MNDFLNIYNPNHAFQLTSEQIAAMQSLTDEQIKALAEKYPNSGNGTAYLILKDVSAKNQIYPASTWQNLYNLRVKNKKLNYIAFTFKSLFVKTNNNNSIPVSIKVQDLTQSEIDEAQGIKKLHSKFEEKIKQNESELGDAININPDEEFPDLTAEVIVKKRPGRKPTIK